MCFLHEASFLNIFLQSWHWTSVLLCTSLMCLVKFTTVLLQVSHQLFLPRNTTNTVISHTTGRHVAFLRCVSSEDLFLNTPWQMLQLSSWFPACTSLRCLFMPLGCRSLQHTSHCTFPSWLPLLSHPRRETGDRRVLYWNWLGLINIMLPPQMVL